MSRSYYCAVANHRTPPAPAKSHTRPSLEVLQSVHMHIHIRTLGYKMDWSLSKLLWCHLVMPLKPQRKTHSNWLRPRHTTSQYRDEGHVWQRVDLQLFDPTNSNIHSYFKEFNLLLDLILAHKETCILLICCPSENDRSATSIPFQFPLLHKLVTGDHFNSYFSRGNCFNRPC